MSSLAPKHLRAFICLLLVTVLHFCIGQSTYYVKPTPDTSCHKDPCHTLSEYASQAERYFTSNTTMVFLPGEHVLQQNVTVSNVGRLAFTGNPSSSPADVSRIICIDVSFTITNTTMLEITDLDFRACTIRLDTSSAVFKNSSFKNGTSKYGGAVYAHSSNITFDGQSTFENNRAEVLGGGIFAEESIITFHGNTTFSNNEATEGGGGIYMNQSDFKFTSNASFIANNVQDLSHLDPQLGGGGVCGYHSSLEFDFSNTVVFMDNSAMTNGGGILVKYSTVNFSGNNRFVNNAAKYGGGVHVVASTVIVGDNSEFVNNSAELRGGGVLVVNSTVTFGDNCEFINNSAGRGGSGARVWDRAVIVEQMYIFITDPVGVGGGGVYVWDSIVSFGDNNGFIDNLAYQGGGVYVWEYSTVSFGDRSEFIDNFGGGVSVEGGTVRFGDKNKFIGNSAGPGIGGGVDVGDSTVSFGDNSKFIDNTARNGGGVSVWDSTVSFGDNSEFINNSAEEGGGVSVWDSTVSFGDNNEFINNSAKYNGGGVLVWEDSTVCFFDKSEFISNSAEDGGGVHVWSSTVSFGDNSEFISNSAQDGGAVLVLEDSTVSFGNNSGFIDNSALGNGGGVSARKSIVNFCDNSELIDNSAWRGGGLHVLGGTVSFGNDSGFINNTAVIAGGGVYVVDSTVRFGDNSGFIQNSAVYGGGISVGEDSTVSFGDKSRFINNSAEYGGGADVHRCGHVISFGNNSEFNNNSAELHGGGVYVEGSTVSFGYSNFLDNSADYFGGCVAAEVSTINMDSSYFTNNSARYGGCIFVDMCRLTFSEATVFSGNSASSQYSGGSGVVSQSILWYGGAILASSSDLIFGRSVTHVLTDNSAGYGGAVYLTFDSKIYLLSYTSVMFERNYAQYRGGALFVQDDPYTYCILDPAILANVQAACFTQTNSYTSCTPDHERSSSNVEQGIELKFQDNTANEAGSDLYGGNLELCGVCVWVYTLGSYGYPYVRGEEAFSIWANTSSHLMSSDPYRVCTCVNSQADCNQHIIIHKIFPGVTINVPAVAFGQYNGTVPAVIQSYTSEGIMLDDLQHTQRSNNTCSDLKYTAFARDINTWSEATLSMYVDEPCSTSGLPLEVFVTFLPCPLGFSLSTEGSCKCDQRLSEYEVDCDINDQSIFRKDNIWIGFDGQSDNQSQSLILHPYCPFHYCKLETDSVKFTMNNTDLQCNYNRSGHLCGACKHGFSLAVGSSRCLPCSNKFLALLMAFVFAGLALVIFLFIFKVTVAAGTISGLLYYANVVTVNQSIFFPSGETNILTVFIAWLNLDLGIETCFFDGMDAYFKMWLQFVFPIYIWLLVGLVTILCNVSTTAARILGSNNPIAILATLFLLSYTKLLRTIIAAFSFTILEYPNEDAKVVWLYDGNIGYLDKNDGRHIALFLASLLVFLFLFLPYTVFLLFGQCILPRLDLNKLRWLSWANYLRMKSFLDAYHAPYKDRHRYWTGLLLVIRFLLFLISAIIEIKSPQDPHVNLLMIIISTSMLEIWVWNASGGVYKKWYLNALESSFIFNLAICSAATYQVKLAGGNQAAVFYSSVSVAFSTYIGIIIYHVYQRLRDSRAWRNLVRKHNERTRERDHGWRMEDAAANEEMEEMLPQAAPTVTYFDIPTDERKEMRPITPPLTNICEPRDNSPREDAEKVEVTPSEPYTPTAKALTLPPINSADLHEPLDHLKREDVVADEVLSEVTPTVTHTPTAKVSTPPPPPINFTDLREPLDLLTQ